MPIPRPEPQDARVIAHVDMDCFYVQVEQRKQPELRGVPTAVVQYNSWKGGGLIAVGYEARKYGVKRSMRGDEAKKACPDIQLIQVPVARGKADLNLYRDAGSEVVSILATKGRCERASIDEVYLDLTDAAESMLLETPEVFDSIDEEALKSHVLGLAPDNNESGKNVREWFRKCDSDHRDKLLACGAIIVAQLRTKVLEETTFTCSAGIAHNKMLAKLASAMHKPAQQTIVPSSSINDLLASLPVKKMKQLGGKLGSSLQSDLGVNTIGDLLQFTEEKLQEHYGGNTGTWLWNTARGISGEEVEGRLLPKSHGCGKTFPGPQALRAIDSVEHWLNQLCEELSERIQSDLEKNKRIAHTLTLHARASKVNDLEPHRKFPSKSCPLRYGTMKIQQDAMRLFESGLREFLDSQSTGWAITSLSVGASKILETPHGTCSILKFFHGQTSSLSSNADSMFAENDVQMGSSDTSSIIPGRKEKQRGFDLEEVDSDYKLSHQAKTLKRTVQSAAKPKDKGTSSILRFFPSSDSSCSSSQLEPTRFVQDKAPELSGRDQVPNSGQTETRSSKFEEDRKGDSSSVSHTPFTQGCTPWAFNVDDIDPSVIEELPLEIQKEVRGWLRPKKPVKAVKRVSNIAQYFSSTKNSQENGDSR